MTGWARIEGVDQSSALNAAILCGPNWSASATSLWVCRAEVSRRNELHLEDRFMVRAALAALGLAATSAYVTDVLFALAIEPRAPA